MEKIDIRRLKSIIRTRKNYLTMAIAFVVMLLLYPIEGRFKYQYKLGSPWIYEDLTAPIDFPILKSAEEIDKERRELLTEVVPYYKVSTSVANATLSDIAEMASRYDVTGDTIRTVDESLRKIYAVGVMPEKEVSDKAIFLRRGRSSVQVIESDLYTKASALQTLRSDLMARFPSADVDSIMSVLNLSSAIAPNLSYDKKVTEELNRIAVNNISPTKGKVYTGETIVLKGETVTADIQQLLDSYKAEYKRSIGYSGNIFMLKLGQAVIIAILLALLFIVLFFSDQEILRVQNKFNFIYFIACLNFFIILFVRKLSPTFLFFVPLAASVLYLASFIQRKAVLPVYILSLVPILMIAENGVELFLINAVAGAVALLTFSINDKGWMQFVNSLYIFGSMVLVHIGISLISSGTLGDVVIILYLLLAAVLTVIFYPLTYVWEKMFYMVSDASLRDLADTDNRLLREMEMKAPGTFQHSLHVANLAERAAVAVGGRSRCARVGGLYHDIGKIMNPQAFIENYPAGFDYHAGLSPKESAAIIIKHVDDGLLLAHKYNLPKLICNFIASHHGHSVAEYFYNIYCNNGGDPADREAFTYQGSLPSTKEEVIVMMADAVEAASHTLKDHSAKSISDMVERVLAKRIAVEQIYKADISMREIGVVKLIFKKQLQEMYHARIEYPEREEKATT